MATTCGASCAKFMLFVFNFVFFLSGAVLLGIGIWLLVDTSITELLDVTKVATDNKDQIQMVSYILIGIGVFIFVVGFFGCCGAIKESKVMLGLYIFMLLVVMGVEIAAGVLALVYKDKVEKDLKSKLLTELQEDRYYNGTSKKYHPFGLTFNVIQQKFSCCGVIGPNDYDNSTFHKENPNLKIPYSCCVLNNNVTDSSKPQEGDVKDWGKCRDEYKDGKKYLYGDGCEKAILDWVKTKLIMLTGIGLGVAALELFGFIFAVCLCRNIDPDKQ